MSEVIVHKHRRNTLRVSLGINVADDTLTSQIRSEPEVDAPLLMSWTVTKTDGVNGELVLTAEAVATGQVVATKGYMDIKRVSGGHAIPVFDKPLEVVFRGSVTE